MNNYQYRRGTPKDIEKLKALGIISYGQYADVLGLDHWPKLNSSLQDDKRWIDLLDNSTCFVCSNKDEIIGMAYIIPKGNPWEIFIADWSYIRMVGVHPGYKGHGIGKTLTSLCIDHAKATNEKTIALHTSEFMDAARHIYESLGFKVLREIEPRFGKKYWLYTLDLT